MASEKTDPIEVHGLALGVIGQCKPDAHQRAHARRHDHEEGGAPVVGLGGNAAEDRAEDGSEHRADTPHHQG
jgi:hypothetical protein